MTKTAQADDSQSDIRYPHDNELERIFLSHAIAGTYYGQVNLGEVLEEIQPEHFWLNNHKAIYRWLADYASNNLPFTWDAFNVLEEAKGESVRKAAEVLLQRDFGPQRDIEAVAFRLKDLYQRRQLIFIAQDAIDLAQKDDPEVDGPDMIENVESRLGDLAVHGARAGIKDLSAIARATEELNQKRRRAKNGIGGVPSGLREVDMRLRGFQPSELIILAGRPGMGKTALCTTIALNAAEQGYHVQFKSLEMSEEQLYMRLIAMKTGLSVQYQGSPDFERDPDANRRKCDAEIEINKLPLYIDASDTQTVADIRSSARRAHRQGKCDILIIDYLGLIVPRDKSMNKVHAIEEITTSLKRLAKKLKIPIILLCQLNRGVEGREDRRPGLADLRDSGAIEQDADVVMAVYREQYYLENQKPPPKEVSAWLQRMDAVAGTGEIITLKYRQGETGIDAVGFDGPRQLFTNDRVRRA